MILSSIRDCCVLGIWCQVVEVKEWKLIYYEVYSNKWYHRLVNVTFRCTSSADLLSYKQKGIIVRNWVEDEIGNGWVSGQKWLKEKDGLTK